VRAALAAPRQPALTARVRERFTWERAARVLADAYRDALAQPTSATPTPDPTADLVAVTGMLAELWELKEPQYHELARRAAEQAAWTKELLNIAAARERERAALLNCAPVRIARQLLRQRG